MPTRGIILGLGLALWVSLFTFFNDTVIRQPLMTGNLMPTSVYGLLVVLTLGGGWWATSRLPGGGLSRADLAVMVVLATAACAWPGSNFFRPFVGSVGHPVNLAKSESAWQHNEVFSYVPGGSPRLAPGQVHDWRGFAETLRNGDAPRPAIPLDLDPALLDRILDAPPDQPVPPDAYRPLLNRLNLAITRESLTDTDLNDRATLDRLNRAALIVAFPEHIDPIPPGNGVLLAGGQDVSDVTGRLVTGSDRREGYQPSNVPWSAWWPVLRLWGGVALCLALAGLCLAVIVHPQWSRHEMLPYPLVRFVEELTRPSNSRDATHPRRNDDMSSTSTRTRTKNENDATHHGVTPSLAWSRTPAILTNRLFHLGLLTVLALHLANGLHEWFPAFPAIPLRYDFTAFEPVFPNAAGKYGSSELFHPTVFFSVLGFAFFIRGDVSFSLGISGLAWVALLAVAASRGVSLGNSYLEPEAGSLLRAGAYLGSALTIIYLGRRYYSRVALNAVFITRHRESGHGAPVWAARLLLLCVLLAVALLYQYAALHPALGLAAVGVILVMLLVIARISAETGAFYIDPSWMPTVLFTALFGFDGLAPSTFIALALVSTVLIGNPREALAAYAINALHLGQRVGRLPPGRSALGMGAVTLIGFALAAAATLTVVYTRGLSPTDAWGVRWHPSLAFDALARRLADAEALGQLQQLQHTALNPQWGSLAWLVLGLALVVGCALARLYLARWPLHPVLFLVLGSAPGVRFAWSFLLGWFLRQAIVRLGGNRAFKQSLPLAVGLIAGELLAALLWQTVGLTYYFTTGQVPRSYYILPD